MSLSIPPIQSLFESIPTSPKKRKDLEGEQLEPKKPALEKEQTPDIMLGDAPQTPKLPTLKLVLNNILQQAACEEEPMDDVPSAPISPEKAPRNLIILSPLDNDKTLAHSVRRALFIEKASNTYQRLSQRDKELAVSRPEQKSDYLERADEYNHKWFEAVVIKSRVKTAISHAGSYSHPKR